MNTAGLPGTGPVTVNVTGGFCINFPVYRTVIASAAPVRVVLSIVTCPEVSSLETVIAGAYVPLMRFPKSSKAFAVSESVAAVPTGAVGRSSCSEIVRGNVPLGPDVGVGPGPGGTALPPPPPPPPQPASAQAMRITDAAFKAARTWRKGFIDLSPAITGWKQAVFVLRFAPPARNERCRTLAHVSARRR